MGNICQQCGSEYERIGSHWSLSNSCSHPSFTDHQKEIITGLLMGDGCVSRADKNPRIQVEMISPNYLQYISNKFGVLGSDVRLKHTAKENAKITRDKGFSPNAKAENYSDLYEWKSMNHPEIKEFANWYSSGKKVWPADIQLTPTVLKHWYCGDGSWNNKGSNNCIRIAMANEVDNTDKVDKMFTKVGLPSPSNYTTRIHKNGNMMCAAQFTMGQSKKLWKYMGEPLPDFEYKWPDRYR